MKRREAAMRATTAMIGVVIVTLLAVVTQQDAAEEGEKKEIKPALLVIDVQNIWLPRMDEEDLRSAPRKINEAISLFREFGHPVIRVYHSDLEHGPAPGSEPFEFPDSIAVTDDDPQIIKNYPGSFTKTELEQILREQDRNAVFLCGLSATGCVLATYFAAMEREFLVLMVKDALLSGDASHTNMIEEICYSVTIEELKETLEHPFQ
jgi:nicotinamidase-related amidase